MRSVSVMASPDRHSRAWIGRALTAATMVAVLAFALLGEDEYDEHLLMWVALNAVLAAGLRFMLLVGETNIATGAFYGMGAYIGAVMTVKFGLSFALALLSGGVLAIAASAVFGLITLRTKGPYFMLISFAFTEVIRLVYTRINWLGGNSGLIGIFPPQEMDPWMPALTVALCSALVLMMYLVERSDLGKIFKAIENNDAVVETVGINVLWIKLLCLTLASFAVGTAGALHAHIYNVISPGDFSYLVPVFALAYVKIGGDSHVLGAVIGAALLTLIAQALQGSGSLEQILFGGAIVASMLVLPDGLWGGARRLLSLLGGCSEVRPSGARR
ncbi:MAG: branched-chain amino acid transport system permease protein [Acetobacteraceae bacterium]|nr:branched-chain amino acid transport system permease protein [Acetobacteraceae bacterium]